VPFRPDNEYGPITNTVIRPDNEYGPITNFILGLCRKLDLICNDFFDKLYGFTFRQTFLKLIVIEIIYIFYSNGNFVTFL